VNAIVACFIVVFGGKFMLMLLAGVMRMLLVSFIVVFWVMQGVYLSAARSSRTCSRQVHALLSNTSFSRIFGT
jgi:hypothetical protein